MNVDCCTNQTYQLSPGDQFNFINNTNQAVEITDCNPPLAALAYSVPAAQNGTPGTCQAQIADGVGAGTYPLNTSGCSALPPHTPTIQVML
jgi:hypothetical protein